MRVVRTEDGGLLVGPGPGRGAWVCPGPDCVAVAATRKAFARALRGPVTDAAVAELRVRFSA